MHAIISMVALLVLTMAALQALLITVQQILLKQQPLQNYSLLQRLPPIETMQRWLLRVLWLGFAFLSCSLLSGFIFWPDVFGRVQLAKLLWATLVWGLFAALLYRYYRHGWHAKRVMVRTVIGAVLLGFICAGSIWIWRN